ncbi:MAG: hypothetical protein ABIT36_07420 [Steroidobacteraceae bacterium]
MKASEVKPGECYRTQNNWVRYVENIEDGKVRYRSRGATFTAGWTTSESFQYQKLQMFAFDVIERVEENWQA